jgi:hypothetical protein
LLTKNQVLNTKRHATKLLKNADGSKFGMCQQFDEVAVRSIVPFKEGQ